MSVAGLETLGLELLLLATEIQVNKFRFGGGKCLACLYRRFEREMPVPVTVFEVRRMVGDGQAFEATRVPRTALRYRGPSSTLGCSRIHRWRS